MFTRNIIFLAAACSTAVTFGGPGTSGGNPKVTIHSLILEYFLQSEMPTRIEDSMDSVTYHFDLTNETLKVRTLVQAPVSCPVSGDKNICPSPNAGDTSITITYSNDRSYQLTVSGPNLTLDEKAQQAYMQAMNFYYYHQVIQ